MKKIILLLTLLIYSATSYCQTKTVTTYDKAWYLKKSRHKQTTGIVFAGLAVAYTVAGFFQPDSTVGWVGAKNKNRDAPYYFALGGISALVSILYFSASARFKRNALNATVSIKNQQILLPQHNGFVFKSQPALILKMPLY